MSSEEALDKILPIFNRMSGSTWFPNKCSTANITPSIFATIDDYECRVTILDEYKKTTRDSMHLVRLQAYKQLCRLIEIAPPSFFNTHLRGFLHHVKHESDNQGKTSINTRTEKFNLVKVALTMLETYGEKAMSAQDILEHSWPWLEQAGTHESWRLRQEFIKSAPRICAGYAKVFGNSSEDINTEKVYPICAKILVDSEPQVRETAIAKFTECLKYFNIEDKNSSNRHLGYVRDMRKFLEIAPRI